VVRGRGGREKEGGRGGGGEGGESIVKLKNL